MPETIEKYGAKWPKELDALQIEMGCIRKEGQWENSKGEKCGNGLPYHYEQMRRILWPELDGEHNGQRWHVLCRDTILANKISVLMGCGSSGKTHAASWIYLCEYLCFPEETCVLVSSTDIRGLKKRVWGEICSLWEKAVDRFNYLPGNMIDSILAIATDNLDDADIENRKSRDLRKGCFGVPCMNSQNTFVGLTKYHGIKQKRMRLVADELSMMGISFLKSFANLNNNVDFRAICLGNPNDTLDPLGRAAEPLDGWDAHMSPEKTSVWKTKFMHGACVNLVGLDSPNMDFPDSEPVRFPYLISRKKIAETITGFGKDTFEYHTQVVGSMITSTLSRRVLTRKMCEEGDALESEVNWLDSVRTRVYFCDSAYGGDRSVAGWGEFGKIVGGKVILLLHPPSCIPIVVRGDKEPEQQIAEYIKNECTGFAIPPRNMGHDSTGRGSLGTFLARAWSAETNPVEAGGQPTLRPVSLDHYINDPKTKQRRLKTCREHYKKFVTETYFSFRYAVQASQIRGLTEETMDEFCQRQWDRTTEDRIELETKDDYKERIGKSPDLADWANGVLEMARRRGFQISKLANEEDVQRSDDWLDKLRQEQRKLESGRALNFA
jgi:hypothetical protein